jgi:multidrug efflux pump subunit AcrA (membrane-fusion protein)
MRFLAIALTGLGLLATSLPAWAVDAATKPIECLLSLDLEAQVPAQEAGVLMEVLVRDGDAVSKGELLAQIDDAVPQLKQKVATFKLDVAKKQALDDVDVRFARAGAEVAKVKYDKSVEANREHPKTVSIVEVNEQRLEWEKFKLSIEKAQKDMDVAGFQMQVSDAELRATEEDIKRRKIIAPLDAVVSELSRHVGEWVQQGETVMRLVRVDLLRAEGYLNAKDFRPSEIYGRPVSVRVEFARGQTETFPGKIVFVAPVIQAGGDFLVRAEVQNRKENGSWVLTAGLPAKMTARPGGAAAALPWTQLLGGERPDRAELFPFPGRRVCYPANARW